MPDTGGFDTAMPRRHRDGDQGLPGDWGHAFSALPLAAPDAGAWQRVQARLPLARHAARARWPVWLATAASLALAVAIPLRMQQDPVPQAATNAAAPSHVATASSEDATRGGIRTIARPGSAGSVASRASPAVPATSPMQAARERSTPASDQMSASAATRSATFRSAAARRTSVARSRAPLQHTIRTPAQSASETRIGVAESAAALEPLYAQSAQLEGLLAMARDDRVASGPVAALAESLDTQVASIDAALVQPDLSSERRTKLWGERVDALRQLVGIAATQRLFAARSQDYDAALVSID